ncbi:unnamed protein product [Thlaspi arvense]|uniref:PGG domain-containing protein n=1 Tax=Thlaspi arvense TaxID=13288 RepID=A0AAU9RG72_THLAR|nr:unnamed protein product [Thlaspi arvense]
MTIWGQEMFAFPFNNKKKEVTGITNFPQKQYIILSLQGSSPTLTKLKVTWRIQLQCFPVQMAGVDVWSQMSKFKLMVMDIYDNDCNTILHLAGKLAPRYKLSLVPGQLYKCNEVEKFGTPRMKNSTNNKNKTPQEVFTEEHKELVAEGEKWMKDTATSCTIAAALIVTIVFAAAITVPGGNNDDNGEPIFFT